MLRAGCLMQQASWGQKGTTVIVKFMNSFQLFVILYLTISCAGQTIKPEEKSLYHPKVSEIQNREQPKLGTSEREGKDYIPGEILVKFRHGTNAQEIEAIQRELHLKTIKIVSRPNLYLMKILDSSSVEGVIQRLRDFHEVVYSEPNYIVTFE